MNIDNLVQNITPELFERLQYGASTGKWPDGTPLSDEQKQNLSKDTAITLLVEQPAMIKRPVLVNDNSYHLGFKAAQYDEIFK